MNIWVYSDESGVFDKEHNEYFVFAGLIFVDKEDRDIATRKYMHAESCIRKSGGYNQDYELKATNISNNEKNKLFRSLNSFYKFAVIVKQKNILDSIFEDKKAKQRYLDYAYKRGLKNALQELIRNGTIIKENVDNIYCFPDEHTTATNGLYELNESLEMEFKRGKYNSNYTYFYPPLFKGLKNVSVENCNSSKKTLVRAADILANKVYYLTTTNQTSKLEEMNNLYYLVLPE